MYCWLPRSSVGVWVELFNSHIPTKVLFYHIYMYTKRHSFHATPRYSIQRHPKTSGTSEIACQTSYTAGQEYDHTPHTTIKHTLSSCSHSAASSSPSLGGRPVDMADLLCNPLTRCSYRNCRQLLISRRWLRFPRPKPRWRPRSSQGNLSRG